MTPIVENDWQEILNNAPLFNINSRRTIFFSPHPDDETLGCGGLIIDLAKLYCDIQIISITNGEAAYEDIPQLGKIRIRELNNSIMQLGLQQKNIVRLNIPDGKIDQTESYLETDLVKYLSSDCNLFAPWKNDYHKDHEALGRIAIKLADQYHITLYFYFIWSWHYHLLDLKKINIQKHILSNATLEKKLKALQCYQSQLKHPSGNPILTDDLLFPFKQPYEVFSIYEK